MLLENVVLNYDFCKQLLDNRKLPLNYFYNIHDNIAMEIPINLAYRL